MKSWIPSDTIQLARIQTFLLFYTALFHSCQHRDLCSPAQCRIFQPSGKLIDHKSSPWQRLRWPEDLDESLTSVPRCARQGTRGQTWFSKHWFTLLSSWCLQAHTHLLYTLSYLWRPSTATHQSSTPPPPTWNFSQHAWPWPFPSRCQDFKCSLYSRALHHCPHSNFKRYECAKNEHTLHTPQILSKHPKVDLSPLSHISLYVGPLYTIPQYYGTTVIVQIN